MKKRIIRVAGIFIVALACFACVKKPITPPEWTYEEKAIKIQLVADSLLNMHSGVPHTLLICAYQLRDPNVFIQFSDTEQGIYKLMECEIFNPSVVASKRLIVHPGTDSTFTLDRAEGAEYLGIVAGYYFLRKDRMIRFFELPVEIEEKGFFHMLFREGEPFKVTRIARPVKLKVDIELGPQQINKVERTKLEDLKSEED